MKAFKALNKKFVIIRSFCFKIVESILLTEEGLPYKMVVRTLKEDMG